MKSKNSIIYNIRYIISFFVCFLVYIVIDFIDYTYYNHKYLFITKSIYYCLIAGLVIGRGIYIFCKNNKVK